MHHRHDCIFDVRYAETDAMGVVHHSRYLPWLEVGRTEWMKAIGSHYTEVERLGFFLVISEVGARYLRPARYGDQVRVSTHLARVRSRQMRFEYEVHRVGDEALLFTGFTEHLLTDKAGTLRRLPPELLALLERNQDEAAPEGDR